MKKTKTGLFYLLSMITLMALLGSCQKEVKQLDRKSRDGTEIVCYKSVVGIVSFNGNQDPTFITSCPDFDIEMEKISGSTGLYSISLTNGQSFDPYRTWLYLQSETSMWRELQISTQPNGKIYINAYQNGVHTDVVSQNVSFEIRQI